MFKNIIQFQLIFGGSDEQYFHGPLAYFPVVDHGRWNVHLASVRIMGRRYCGSDCNSSTALIDTGTSYIVGPADAVNQLNARLGAVYDAIHGLYKLECDTVDFLPDVEFVLGEAATSFTLTSDDYVLLIDGNCFSAIYSIYGRFDWILGNTFMYVTQLVL